MDGMLNELLSLLTVLSLMCHECGCGCIPVLTASLLSPCPAASLFHHCCLLAVSVIPLSPLSLHWHCEGVGVVSAMLNKPLSLSIGHVLVLILFLIAL